MSGSPMKMMKNGRVSYTTTKKNERANYRKMNSTGWKTNSTTATSLSYRMSGNYHHHLPGQKLRRRAQGLTTRAENDARATLKCGCCM